MNKLLIGTTNQAKFENYRKLLSEYGLQLVSAKDLNLREPEETGKTFEENAILKAKYYYAKSGLPTLVDDGGIEIDALNGEPGVMSHRWLEADNSDENLIKTVLMRMKEVPDENRGCKFSVVIAIATPFGIFTSHGEITGMVAQSPSTKRIPGYPYRSIMYLPNYGKYFCDVSDEENKILDHRRHALEKIKDIFKELAKA